MRKSIWISILIMLLIPSAVLAEFTMGSSASNLDVCSSETSLLIITTTNTGPNADTFNIGLSEEAAKWSVVAPQGFVLQPGQTQNSYIYTTVPTTTKVGTYDLSASISSNSVGQQTQKYFVNVGACNSLDITPVSADSDFCTCTDKTFEFLVKNTGRWAENYKLSLSGSASKWATLSETSLGLDSDESKAITASIAPTCGETGDFKLTLTAESMDSDVVESSTIDLGVDGCYDFSFALAENYLSFCDNSEAKIPVTIQNKGTVKNGYALEVDGPSWASFDKKKVTSNAGKSEISNLILSPGLGIQGNFPMSITVSSEEGDNVFEESFTANVLSCRETSIELSQKSDVLCGGNSKLYSTSIVNAGKFDEKYALSLEGPTWASLGGNFVSLSEGGSATVDLELTPNVNVEPGTYTIIVSAESQNIGKTSDSDIIEVTISSRDSCFGVQLESESTDIELRHGEGELIPIVINNIGASDANYELEISGDGANLAQLNPGIVELEGNSAETVYLHLSAPEDTSVRRYRVTVSARSVADQTVTGSTSVAFNVLEAQVQPQTPSEDEPTSEASSDEEETAGTTDDTKSGALQTVSSAATKALSSIKSKVAVGGAIAKDIAYSYWHLLLIAFGVLLLIIVVFRFGIFRKEEDWFDDFEDLFNEDGEFAPDDEDKKTKSKSSEKPKSKPKGIFGKFIAWLTEEDDFDDFDFDFEDSKKKKAKKDKGTGMFGKFKNWLEEDEFDIEPKKKTKPKAKAKAPEKKSKPKAAKKSKWSGFVDWLYEDDEVPVKLKKTPAKGPAKKAEKSKPKAAKKSVWGKFVDWLYEDDEEIKPVAKNGAPAKKTPSKKAKTKKTSKRKSTKRKK